MLLLFVMLAVAAFWSSGWLSLLLWILFYSEGAFVLGSILIHTVWHLATLPPLDTYPGSG